MKMRWNLWISHYLSNILLQFLASSKIHRRNYYNQIIHWDTMKRNNFVVAVVAILTLSVAAFAIANECIDGDANAGM